MAAPHGKFFIQDKLAKPAPHHASFKALWDTKWAKPCEMAVYPFMFASKKDFEPIVDEMVKLDMKEPYDWDAYASVFAPHAEKLVARAEEAEKAGEIEKASVLYLRASAVYRISRFPAPRSDKQREAWTKGKAACTKGLGMREHPTKEIQVPHKHAGAGEGSTIPVYLTLPETASSSSPAPLILIMTGLDGYRTELAVWSEGWRRIGCACMVVEIPGTGDSPADRNDPTSPDREWSSLLEWIATQPEIDAKKIVVWAFSTGGFYAIRLAHTHPDKLLGTVALGGGVHHMFDPEWLSEVNHLEYPFDLATTLCYKFGYGTDIERFKKEGRAKFSLLEDGTLDKPCGKLLLVNGTEDEIFPIDDYYLCLQHGDPKEARFVTDTKHMGEPASFFIILKWIYKLLDIKANPGDQMKCMITKPKAEYLE